MPRPTALDPNQIEAALRGLPGWSIAEGKLHRELRFPNFQQAFAFMAEAALHAEKLDHHPDWVERVARVGRLLDELRGGGRRR